MKNLLAGCAIAALMTPAAAFAEVKTGGEIYLGYGNSGDQGEDVLGYANAFVEGTQTLDNGFELTYKGAITFRTDRDDIGYLNDDIIDGSFTLDMQSFGKVSVTSFTDDFLPWVTGEVRDRGSKAVHIGVGPQFAPVADDYTLIVDGVAQKVERDFIVTYENNFGKLGFEAVFDPFRQFGPLRGADVTSPAGDIPQAQVTLTYPTGFGIYSVSVNDLSDTRLDVTLPFRSAGVTLRANHEISGDSSDDTRTGLALIYRPQNMGPLRAVVVNHTFDSNDRERSILTTRFGGKKWSAGFSTDTDGDYAIEASYAIADNIKLLAGYDSGHAFTEGFDAKRTPPVFATPREEAFEIGISFTF